MDPTTPVDGITSAPAAAVPPPAADRTVIVKGRMKRIIIMFVAIPYVLFVVWCFLLLSLLPNFEGNYAALIPIGMLSGFIGALVLLGMGAFVFFHILKSKVYGTPKILSYLRLGLFLPGIALGLFTAFAVGGEPALRMQVIEPASAEQLIAPLPVTLSLELAAESLKNHGKQPVAYRWDFENDGEQNQETVTPTVTAVYDRSGLYTVAAKIRLSDGTERLVTMRLAIAKEVFRMEPPLPVVDEPVRFSVASLVDDPEQITEVTWDFDGDGEVDETVQTVDIVHTFASIGTYNVKAVVLLATQQQLSLQREVVVGEPQALPFPVRIVTEPERLIGPAPLLTVFKIETEEPIRSVSWDFADGEVLDGERVGHTFSTRGNYPVTVEVRSASGETALLTTLVRVVPELRVPDLALDGTPTVNMSQKEIRGEVPLTIDLSPRSSLTPIDYYWEVTGATEVGSTEGRLQAIFRRPGTYQIVLLAQDPAGSAMRLPLSVVVEPPSSLVTLKMMPEGGEAPLEVTFDASETSIPDEDISGFEWFFGDVVGETPRQGVAVVKHKYEKPGTYTVRLTARTTQGNTYETTRTIVVRTPLLDACFTASRVAGVAPLGVSFSSACSTGEFASVSWDFDDGAVTDEPNPIHVFEDPGTYDVRLTVKDSGSVESSHTVTISVE